MGFVMAGVGGTDGGAAALGCVGGGGGWGTFGTFSGGITVADEGVTGDVEEGGVGGALAVSLLRVPGRTVVSVLFFSSANHLW